MNFLDLINIDIRTLIAVSFWYNSMAVLINIAYSISIKKENESKILMTMTFAKAFQALAFFLIFFRDSIPFFLSVNVGNSLLFVGFFVEALSINKMLVNRPKWRINLLAVMLGIALLLFNLVEVFYPYPNIRTATATVGVFIILLVPTISLLANKESNIFKRVTGLFYLIFIIMLLPRAVLMLAHTEMTVFSNNAVQALSFLALLMVNILSVSTSIFSMKEEADNVNKILAHTDYLTKLSNRYSFLNSAEKVFELHKHNKAQMSVLFLDLDRFKLVNDQYGHNFGDKVLVRFSDMLKSALREVDLVCRYGGEEFVVFLPNVDFKVCMKVATRILENVREMRFEEFPDFKTTTSIGATGGIPQNGDTLIEFIEKADALLYKAKETGRDRIEGTPYRD